MDECLTDRTVWWSWQPNPDRSRRRWSCYSEVVKRQANSYRTVELPPPGAPVSALGRKLTRLRKKIEGSGEKLLTREEVNREVRRRRGLA